MSYWVGYLYPYPICSFNMEFTMNNIQANKYDRIKEINKEFTQTPKVGIRWTDRFAHVGLVLDCNEYAVLWADKKIEVDKNSYRIDYVNASVISIDKYRNITQYADVIHPEYNYAEPYLKAIEDNKISKRTLPTTKEEYQVLLEKEIEDAIYEKRYETLGAPKITMRDMSSNGKKEWYIELPDSTYVDVKLVDGKCEIFIKDKDKIEGFGIV